MADTVPAPRSPITVDITVHLEVDDRRMAALVEGLPEMFAELLSEDDKRQIVSLRGFLRDGRGSGLDGHGTPLAEVAYRRGAVPEEDVRHVRIAGPEDLADLGTAS